MENDLSGKAAVTTRQERDREILLLAESERPRDEEVSILQLLTVLLKHRILIFLSALVISVLAVLPAFAGSGSYTATASLMPQGARTGGGGGGAAALASQLGLDLRDSDASRSPQFYADLLKSREILGAILMDSFTVNEARGDDTVYVTGTLADLLGVEGETEGLRRADGIRRLQNAITTNTTPTALVELEVRSAWPSVSRGIAERLIEQLNEFNLQRRQSEAREERSFIEERRTGAAEELLAAEEELKRFLETNRQFRGSPELLFEHDRLQRQVVMRQQVFTSLSQSFEQARISEVRTTPVITVVERPEEPVRPDGRGLKLRAIVGLILGGALGVIFAFGREMLQRSRTDGSEDYRQFHDVWGETIGDLHRPFRLLKKG